MGPSYLEHTGSAHSLTFSVVDDLCLGSETLLAVPSDRASVQDSNCIWIQMYVPLVNILFTRSTAFKLRMAQYSHVLVDEVQARSTHHLSPSAP
jgi:hypothetical protein